mgnify:CR=1 FL=1
MIVDSKSPPRYSYREIRTLVTDGAFVAVRERACRSHQAARICLGGGVLWQGHELSEVKKKNWLLSKKFLQANQHPVGKWMELTTLRFVDW